MKGQVVFVIVIIIAAGIIALAIGQGQKNTISFWNVNNTTIVLNETSLPWENITGFPGIDLLDWNNITGFPGITELPQANLSGITLPAANVTGLVSGGGGLVNQSNITSGITIPLINTTGSTSNECSGTEKMVNVTLTNGVIIAVCDTDITGADTNNYPTSISFSGTTTKTLTLSRSGLSDLTAVFDDLGSSTLPFENITGFNITIEWNNITGFPGITGLDIETNYTFNGITNLPQANLSGIILPWNNVTEFPGVTGLAIGTNYTFPGVTGLIIGTNYTFSGGNIPWTNVTGFPGVTGLTIGTNYTFPGVTGLTLGTNYSFPGVTGLTLGTNYTFPGGSMPWTNVTGFPGVTGLAIGTNYTFNGITNLPQANLSGITLPSENVTGLTSNGISIPQENITTGITIPLENTTGSHTRTCSFPFVISRVSIINGNFTEKCQMPASFGQLIPYSKVENYGFSLFYDGSGYDIDTEHFDVGSTNYTEYGGGISIMRTIQTINISRIIGTKLQYATLWIPLRGGTPDAILYNISVYSNYSLGLDDSYCESNGETCWNKTNSGNLVVDRTNFTSEDIPLDGSVDENIFKYYPYDITNDLQKAADNGNDLYTFWLKVSNETSERLTSDVGSDIITLGEQGDNIIIKLEYQTEQDFGNIIPWTNITGFSGVTGLTIGTNYTFSGITGLPTTNYTAFAVTGLSQSNFTGMTWPANNVTNGTFGSGNSVFQNNLTVATNLTTGCASMGTTSWKCNMSLSGTNQWIVWNSTGIYISGG